MARIEDVKDPLYRTALEQIDNLLGEGDYTGAAKKAAETYVNLVSQHPELIPPTAVALAPQATPGLPGAARSPSPPAGGAGFGANRFGWPNTGALRVQFGPDRLPIVTYDKERYSFSEAATYFEFVMGEAIRAQQ
ncbi:MAG TPA: hypothetical protein VFY10_00940 [Dehalococcoidia bacterium]|nr:hypothetical protein [Dehalococcoidia bacterium]